MGQKESYLLGQADELFKKRGSLMFHWQNIAENFYPERADFTTDRSLGEEYATNLATGYPLLVRRELGNQFGAMLRPTFKKWFHTRTENWETVSAEGRRWLERTEEIQRRRMYHRNSNFVVASKQGDHDYAAFGQYVNQISLDRDAVGLLYRNWHLRDCAWIDNTSNQMDTMYRKYKPTYIDLVRTFGINGVHQKVKDKVDKTPYATLDAIHIIMPNDVSTKFNHALPFIGIHLDATHSHIMEEVGLARQEYIVPRWARLSGTQYAHSPATMIGLADARTLQDMTITLLEAGEKATTPPMVGVKGALRSDVNLMAGGITWVDKAYDQRLGEVMRPITIDKSGIPTGFEMAADYREQLFKAFYLDKMTMQPTVEGAVERTAYEVGQDVQAYIRNALPLFEPMETEANSPTCELTFEILLAQGAFGAVQDMPKELQGANIEFVFESPLHDAIEREKGQKFAEAQQVVTGGAGIDPEVVVILDAKQAARDTLHGLGTPANWVLDEAETKEKIEANRKAQEQQAQLEQLQQGADIAKTVGETAELTGATATAGGNRPGGL